MCQTNPEREEWTEVTKILKGKNMTISKATNTQGNYHDAVPYHTYALRGKKIVTVVIKAVPEYMS